MPIDSAFIKQTALSKGFSACGVTKAGFLSEEADRLEEWLNKGYHGEMSWMENHFDKRLDTTKLVPGAKSVISLVYNYFPEKDVKPNLPKISKYAFGQDYHHVVKNHLREMVLELTEKYGSFEHRVFVDSAPVMERALAAKAGLGWIGKHSLLLNKNLGSFFFIAQIVVDLEIEVDGPTTDHCGTCTACIDACPTDAIVENKVVDASQCISYLTIELKDEIPSKFQGKMDDWVFGCDICQDVCPWNRFSKPHSEPQFAALAGVNDNDWKDWQAITATAFKKRFKSSAISRTGHKGFIRNLNFSIVNGKQ